MAGFSKNMTFAGNEESSYRFDNDIVWIRQAFDHHSSASGYDRLCCVLEKRIASNTHSIWYQDPQSPRQKDSDKNDRVRIRRPHKNVFRHRGTLPEFKALFYKPFGKKIIHVMYGELVMGLLRFKPLRGRSKLVLTVHQPQHWWRNHDIPPDYYDGIDAVIVLSSTELDYFNKKTKGRAFYVPHGVDTRFFSAASKEQIRFRNERREFSCLTVGQWERDFRTLERVVDILAGKDETIFFDIVISGHLIASHPHRAHLSRLLKHRHVRWHNQISDSQLAHLYKTSNILLLPVLNAVANNTLLEASASGLPIVAPHVGGIRNYTTDDFSILTPVGDAMAMADAVAHMRNTPQKNYLRSEMAGKNAMDKYSWDVVSQKTAAIYQTL